MRLLLVALALWLASAPASARQVYQGGDLLRNCATEAVCDAFLSAMLDTRATLVAWTGGQHAICPPRPLTTAEVWSTVGPDLQQRSPDRLRFYASSIALNSLQQTYRCPAGAPGSGPVLQRFLDGLELASMCANRAQCEAFVIGVMDTHQVLVDLKVVAPMVCMPEETHIRDGILTVLTYVGQHPEEYGYSAASLALRALVARYPC